MKKYIILILTFVLSAQMNAQVDRSIQPKPGPAPKINLENPQTFKLKNGLEVLVVENHKLPKVSLSLRIDNEPITEGDKAGTSDLAGSLLGSGSENMSKQNFDERVDFLGARVFFNPEGAYASSLTKYFPEVFGLVAEAALHPKFTKEEFDKNKERTIDGLKSNENSVDEISNRLRKAVGYGKNHPYGEFKTEKTVKNITLQDVKDYYNNYYKPNNAYLVIVGDITLKEAKKLTKKYFKKWKKGDLKSVNLPKPKNVNKTVIAFADMPNAVQSVVSVISNTNLKMADKDYFAVLLANQILGGDFNSYLNMNLREAHGYTYGARSSINADKYATMFRTSASVRNAVTDSTVMETIKEIKRIRTEKVDPETLKNVKAGYVGKFVMALEKPQTIANYALNIKTKDLPEDFYKTYLEKINAVTVDDILRVSKKYFNVDNARIMVTGKAIDVLPNLEKLGYDIVYYDTKANLTEKPEMSKPIPSGVTLQTVVDNYVSAIGGKDKVDAVKTVNLTYEASMQGQVLTMNIKAKAPNKKLMTLGMMGMTMMKNAFNGESGYTESQGQKKVMEGEELEESKKSAAPFDELGIINTGMLKGVEPVNGEDMYKVAIGKKMAYFGVKSGLKVKDVITSKGPGGKDVSQTISYDDYKDYDGVKFPSTMKISFGPQILDFKLKEVKINQDVTDKDFE
jgi:predicted Zn-dependent peptidase